MKTVTSTKRSYEERTLEFMSLNNIRGMAPAVTGIILILGFIASTACSRFESLYRSNEQSKAVNEFNFMIPADLGGASERFASTRDSSFVILIDSEGAVRIDSIESQPIAVESLGERLRAYTAGKAVHEKSICIAATSNAPTSSILAVIGVLRSSKENRFGLLTRRRTPAERKENFSDKYDEGLGDIPEPDRIFDVELKSMISADGKPNPLTLVLRASKTSGLSINNEPTSESDLGERLGNIFKDREANGVFREGTNEIEKSVWLQIDATDIENYGDIVKLTGLLRAAGASPIILSDASNIPGLPSIAHSRPTEGNISTDLSAGNGTSPKTISGGVLNGKAISLPQPPYPAAARSVRANGNVSVQVLVDEAGNVVSANAVSGHPLLRAAATQAARGAKFNPTELSGTKVKVTGVIVYSFEL